MLIGACCVDAVHVAVRLQLHGTSSNRPQDRRFPDAKVCFGDDPVPGGASGSEVWMDNAASSSRNREHKTTPEARLQGDAKGANMEKVISATRQLRVAVSKMEQVRKERSTSSRRSSGTSSLEVHG